MVEISISSLDNRKTFYYSSVVPVDPKTLPQDPETLQRMLVDLTAQLDRTERLLRQLLAAKTGRKSEQLSPDQLALFAAEAGVAVEEESEDEDDILPPPASGASTKKPHGRRRI